MAEAWIERLEYKGIEAGVEPCMVPTIFMKRIKEYLSQPQPRKWLHVVERQDLIDVGRDEPG